MLYDALCSSVCDVGVGQLPLDGQCTAMLVNTVIPDSGRYFLIGNAA